MALDDFLARECAASGYSAIVRLYRWRRPTLSCGFHQAIDARVDLEGCRNEGVDVVRRPTGGRELLHENDLSFSITNFLDPKSGEVLSLAASNFIKACGIVGSALGLLGVQTRVANRRRKIVNSGLTPCAASPAQFELLSAGKKIVPMAQRVYQNSVLVHGSIPLVRQSIITGRLLKTADPEGLQRAIDESSCSLEDILGAKPQVSKLIQSFFETVRVSYRGEVDRLGLTDQELTRASIKAFKWSINLNQN